MAKYYKIGVSDGYKHRWLYINEEPKKWIRCTGLLMFDAFEVSKREYYNAKVKPSAKAV